MPQQENEPPPDLTVLYENENLLAVYKEAGWLVHRTNLDTEDELILLQQAKAYAGYLYPLHRLDRPTAGIVVFAKTREWAAALSEAFRENKIKKTYLAVVRGYAPESETITAPVKSKRDPRVTASLRPPKEGTTVLKRLATVELKIPVDRYPTARYSLVELKPTTGRRHQLRYHMKHIRHPIIGDSNYGKTTHNRFFAAELNLPGLILCSVELCLPYPDEENKLVLKAPPPVHIRAASDRFGWAY